MTKCNSLSIQPDRLQIVPQVDHVYARDVSDRRSLHVIVDAPGRLFKRVRMRVPGKKQVKLVAELNGVKVYIANDSILVTERDIY